MLKNSKSGYGAVAKGFHWIVALIVLGMLCLGYLMVQLSHSNPVKLELYWWHKSFGTLVLFLVSLRLLWRFANPRPDRILSQALWERRLAAFVHVLLYVGVFLMPLSGWIMSSAADFAHPFFGLFNMPHITPKSRALFQAARQVHETGALALLTAIALHGAGAIKHHFFDRDATLLRMLPAFLPRPGAALAVGVFVVLAGGASILGPLHNVFAGKKPEIARPAQHVQAVPAMNNESARDNLARHWTILPAQSTIGFSATVQGSDFTGTFSDFTGDINFDPDDLAHSAVAMQVDTASVQTGSDERDQTMTLPVWLASSQFPQAKFVSDKFERTGENSYTASGTLTLRGVTQPVNVPFTLDIEDSGQGGKIASMKGSFTVKRLDFDIGQKEWADPKTVAHSVTVNVSLTATSR